MRWVIVRVLPVPAPASTQTGPRGSQHGLALLVVEVGNQWVCDHRHGVHLGSGRRQTPGSATPRHTDGRTLCLNEL